MTQHARDLTVLDGGFDGAAIKSKNSIAAPLRSLEKWLSAAELSELANINHRNARNAIKSRKWRGEELDVREVRIGRGGAGGKALQVHVDCLPSDLKDAWYLQHGIDLHAKREGVQPRLSKSRRS